MSTPKKSPSGVSFRRMQEEDKPSIFEISQLIPWTGDYLTVCLDTWSKDPNRLLISMLLGEKVVGFFCHTYLDNGKTRFSEAARIHPKYIGSGIYKEYKNQMSSLVKQYGFDEKVRSRWAKFIEDDMHGINAKYLHTVWTQFVISHQGLHVLNNLRNVVQNINNNHVKPISKVNYKQLYEHISTFFPSRDLILLSWTAWDPTLSNLKLLAEGRYEPRHSSVEYWLGGWQVKDGTGFGKSYSISCMSPVDYGPYYIVTIHTKDWKQFFHHLHHHVQIFQQLLLGPNAPKNFMCSFDVELQSRFLQIVTGTPGTGFRDEFFLFQVGVFQNDLGLVQSKL